MTALLTTYDEFTARVEALGFMALSPLVPGLPSLGGETAESQWHKGLDSKIAGWAASPPCCCALST